MGADSPQALTGSSIVGRFVLRILVFFFFLFIDPLPASQPAKMQGTVRDLTGAVIPAATIRLVPIPEEAGTPAIQTSTDDLGSFQITVPEAGRYRLEVWAPGFRLSVQTVEIAPGDAPPLDVSLELAVLEETADVVAGRGPAGSTPPLTPIDHPLEVPPFLKGEKPKPSLPLHGRFSTDWFGLHRQGGLDQQLSNRLRLTLGQPGSGWTLLVDLRDRMELGGEARHRLSIYDTRLMFDNSHHPIYFSVGQMNLFDTAGIGELLGSVIAYRPAPRLLIGGYYGFRPELYAGGLDSAYRKFGWFVHYIRPRGQNLSLSLNELRYSGETERRFVYLGGLTHAGDRVVVFGNLEYELGKSVRRGDRLSRLFLNTRLDLTPDLALTVHFSEGRGLDFHRFLLESAEDPIGRASELERFYFNRQYGLRLRYRLWRGWRLHFGQGLSERKDRSIRNHSTQIGMSTGNLGDTGLSIHATYRLNRGDESESDAARLSISKALGHHSWNITYSNSFNGLRFDSTGGLPEIVHIPSRHTLGNELFFVIGRELGLSFQHERIFGHGYQEDLLFIRLICRL